MKVYKKRNKKNVINAKAMRSMTKSKEPKPRKFGLWKGKIFVPDNFNDEDEEINKLFYEGEVFPKRETTR